MSRELKILHIETSGAARDLLDAMHNLTSSEAWALFDALVSNAFSDEIFAGQVTTVLTTGEAIERKVAELVGRRAAAVYIMRLPRLLMNDCKKMLEEESRGVVASAE